LAGPHAHDYTGVKAYLPSKMVIDIPNEKKFKKVTIYKYGWVG